MASLGMWKCPVGVAYLDFIIPRETIHEGEGFMSCKHIDNLVDEWGSVILLLKSFVKIVKIGTNTYGALFFHDRNRVGNPWCVSDGVDKPDLMKLIEFSFNFFYLRWVKLTLFLVYWWYVRLGVNVVLYYSGTKPSHFWVFPCEDVSILLQ